MGGKWDQVNNRLHNYIIVNDRLKSNIEDTKVFRGSEIDSDHKLVKENLSF